MPERASPEPGWSDRRLVRDCLAGDERAWVALVEKYQNLVYSFLLKSGVPVDEAADLFQAVWLDAYNDLPKLRRKAAFKSWLLTLANHKRYHWRQRQRRRRVVEVEAPEDGLDQRAVVEPGFVEELEREQIVREAIFALPARCRELIRLLFFTFPPTPYRQIAERLGLATGSIGFIRGRCLKRLQKTLEKHGLS